MITGKALAYFRAFARCCPPHPEDTRVPGCLIVFLTLRNSIRHCRNLIKLGTLMIIGTKYGPPQPRSGFAVEDDVLESNIHSDTKRSPRTLAYDVRTSASNMSPNLPSCASAIPPRLTLFKVVRNRYRPDLERRLRGRMKSTARSKRYDCGRISHTTTNDLFRRVMVQNKNREISKGTDTSIARR